MARLHPNMKSRSLVSNLLNLMFGILPTLFFLHRATQSHYDRAHRLLRCEFGDPVRRVPHLSTSHFNTPQNRCVRLHRHRCTHDNCLAVRQLHLTRHFRLGRSTPVFATPADALVASTSSGALLARGALGVVARQYHSMGCVRAMGSTCRARHIWWSAYLLLEGFAASVRPEGSNGQARGQVGGNELVPQRSCAGPSRYPA